MPTDEKPFSPYPSQPSVNVQTIQRPFSIKIKTRFCVEHACWLESFTLHLNMPSGSSKKDGQPINSEAASGKRFLCDFSYPFFERLHCTIIVSLLPQITLHFIATSSSTIVF